MEKINSDLTRTLAQFVVETKYADLPKEAVDASKRCLLDWLGVTLAGSKEKMSSVLLRAMEETGGKKQATVLGKGVKTSLFNAALINGTMSHVLDYDDLYQPAHIHPSATLFPAILSVAERDHLSGKDIVSAFVLGFEVESRIGEVSGSELLEKGCHPTACLGAFGAALGVGKLLGLKPEQMVNSLGIAYTKASGLVAAFGTMSKSLQVGKSAANGLLSAQLGQKGFTGPKEVFGGEKGFFKVFLNAPQPEGIVANLGKDYRVTRDSFKLYASCGGTHASIDAVLAARRKYPIDPSEITDIDCQVWPLAPHVCGNPDPRTGFEGKFSVQYCVSVALVDGQVGQQQFSDAKMRNPKIANLTRRVRIFANPAFDDRQAIVTIKTKDGKEYKEKTDCFKGNPENPLNWEDLENKFLAATSKILARDKVNKVVRSIMELEKLEDINALIRLCTGKKSLHRSQ